MSTVLVEKGTVREECRNGYYIFYDSNNNILETCDTGEHEETLKELREAGYEVIRWITIMYQKGAIKNDTGVSSWKRMLISC